MRQAVACYNNGIGGDDARRNLEGKMGEMDQGLKRLMQLAPQDFLTFALPGCEYLGPLDPTVGMERELLADTLQLGRYQGQPCIVNPEFQAVGEPDVPIQMHRYATRATAQHNLPVISIVFYLQNKGPRPPSPYVERVGDLVVATRAFLSVEVSAIPAQQIIAAKIVGLLPLVPFMTGADEAVDEAAMRIITEEAPEAVKLPLATILAVFIARQYDEATAKAILGRLAMNTQLLEESPLYQTWVREARAAGEAAGRAEGRAAGEAAGRAAGEAAGRAAGELEAARLMTRRALEAKYQALAPDVVAALAQAERTTLEGIVSRLFTDTLADVRAQLGLPAEE